MTSSSSWMRATLSKRLSSFSARRYLFRGVHELNLTSSVSRSGQCNVKRRPDSRLERGFGTLRPRPDLGARKTRYLDQPGFYSLHAFTAVFEATMNVCVSDLARLNVTVGPRPSAASTRKRAQVSQPPPIILAGRKTQLNTRSCI